jgi:toxin YoeB
MSYKISFTKNAEKEVFVFKKNEPVVYRKILSLLSELSEHPYTGTGKPKSLQHRPGQWSRRITGKHRLVYSVDDEKITVLIVSAAGHYEDR